MDCLLQTFQLVMQLVDASAARAHQTDGGTVNIAVNKAMMAATFCFFPEFIFMN